MTRKHVVGTKTTKSLCIFLAATAALGASLAGCIMPEQVPPVVDRRKAYIDASTTLRQAADDSDAVTRAHAMEALALVRPSQAGPVLKQALGDSYPAVRFAAAMAIGDVKYLPAKEILQSMAQRRDKSDLAEPDKRVLCAVIYALHRLGETGFTSELAGLLRDGEKEVRANAAMVMGKMDEPSARFPLKMQMDVEHDPSVQLQLMESLALLGDEENALRLEGHTKTQFMEDRLVAIEAMEKTRSSRSLPVLRHLTIERQPPRIRVAALGALAKMGDVDQDGYEYIVRCITHSDDVMRRAYTDGREIASLEITSLQRLAAITLGQMGKPEGADVLHPLLLSADGGVRVAAAMSLVNLLAAYEPVTAAPVAESPAVETPADKGEMDLPLPSLHVSGAKD